MLSDMITFYFNSVSGIALRWARSVGGGSAGLRSGLGRRCGCVAQGLDARFEIVNVQPGVDTVNRPRCVADESHCMALGNSSARQACDHGDARAVEAQVPQPYFAEEQPPLLRWHIWQLTRALPPFGLQLLEQGQQFGREHRRMRAATFGH